MQPEEIIREKVGKETPFKVPEGYFEDFSVRIMSQLPDYPAPPVPQKLSAWHKVRPYVYLAAMFAGIWCMMKVFYLSSGQHAEQDATPDAVVLAMNDADTYAFYTEDNGASDFELEEEVGSMYSTIDEFEKDFYSI